MTNYGKNSIPNKMTSLILLHVGLFVVCVCSQETDFGCDLAADTCPTQNDGVCDSELGRGIPECIGGDCNDCDFCFFFDLDCGSCIEFGCVWCANSGKCKCQENASSPLTHIDLDEILKTIPQSGANSNLRTIDGTDCNAVDDYFENSCGPSENFFSDPLYSAQSWAFRMIDIEPVWKMGLFGKGMRLRVNDDGLDGDNTEFEGRFDASSSCTNYAPASRLRFHGTAVASIAAGGANNDCAVGIAPEASLSACFVLDDPALALGEKNEQQDVSLNAYGRDACRGRRRLQTTECPFKATDDSERSPCVVCDFAKPEPKPAACGFAVEEHCEAKFDEDKVACIEYLDLFLENGRCNYNIIPPREQEAIADGIVNGRDGKGIVYIFSSGNTRRAGDHASFQGYLNSRFLISVGGVDRKGFHAPYSVGGASLFLTAPAGNEDYEVNHIMSLPGSICSSPEGGYGTSLSAPVVAGVVLLMLEANPSLSWRDVQGILAITSKFLQSDASDSTLVTNAAGFTHSDLYGFGIVQASAAVEAARTWQLYGEEKVLVGESRELNDYVIPDDVESRITSTITLFSEEEFIIESAVVYLDLQHFSRGDLDIRLTSPGGTTSILHPGNRPENTLVEEGETWKFMTVKSLGEEAGGNWTLSISDISPGDLESCQNMEFSTLANNGTELVDCSVVQTEKLCTDPLLEDDDVMAILQYPDDEGNTALSACCQCGGGIRANTFDDILKGWQLAVYGRTDFAPREAPTTKEPANRQEEPTMPPSVGDFNEEEPTMPPSVDSNIEEFTPDPSGTTGIKVNAALLLTFVLYQVTK